MGILIIIVAKIALILSFIAIKRSNRIAKTDFILSHRPYVWAKNMKSKSALNEVNIKVLNSPAKMKRETYSYYIIDKQENKTPIEEQKHSNIIRYPDKTQYTNTSPRVTDAVVQNLNGGQYLERIIELEYSWLSDNKRYFFNSKSRWDKKSHQWISIHQIAD